MGLSRRCHRVTRLLHAFCFDTVSKISRFRFSDFRIFDFRDTLLCIISPKHNSECVSEIENTKVRNTTEYESPKHIRSVPVKYVIFSDFRIVVLVFCFVFVVVAFFFFFVPPGQRAYSYKQAHTHTHTQTRTHTHIHKQAHTHTYTYTNKHTHTSTHTRTHTHTHTSTHTHIQTSTHTHIQTSTHTHTQISAHTHTHTQAHTHISTHTHTQTHTHTSTHTHIHTHTHTYSFSAMRRDLIFRSNITFNLKLSYTVVCHFCFLISFFSFSSLLLSLKRSVCSNHPAFFHSQHKVDENPILWILEGVRPEIKLTAN